MGYYILKVLYSKIWVIIGIPLGAGIVAYFFTRNFEKEYKSTAQLSTGFTIHKKGQPAKGNDDYWELQVNFENFIEIMKSEPISSMVSYQLLLHDLGKGTPFRERTPLVLTRAEQDSARIKLKESLASFRLMSGYDEFENRIVELVEKKDYNMAKWVHEQTLMIERIEDTDYIKVECISEDPFLSAFIVNALCNETIRYNNSLNNNNKSITQEDSVQFLAVEAVKKKKDLEDKTERLRKLRAGSQSQHEGYDKENDSKLAQLAGYQMRLREEEGRANGLLVSLKSIKSKIAEYDKRPKVVNNPKPPKNDKLVELQKKINELNKIYVDNGSKDKALAATIRKLRDQLQARMAKLEPEPVKTAEDPNVRDGLIAENKKVELEYSRVESGILSLRAKVNRLKSDFSNTPKSNSPDSTIASLEREHDAAFKDYAGAIEKLKEAKSKTVTADTGVKLTVSGRPSTEPESSKSLTIMVLATIGCCVLCLVKIIAGEYYRATSLSPLISKNKSNYRKIFLFWRKFTI